MARLHISRSRRKGDRLATARMPGDFLENCAMPDEPKNPEKKLIIDEDWKSQVEAEKEIARQEAEDKPTGEPAQPDEAHAPLPPADLTFLVSTLYLQGALGLGLLPNPATNKPEVQLDQAQHAIDTLAMLQQKTEGNRTTDESEELQAALHELRLTFITVKESLAAK